jgi:hypothetical protein
MRLLRAAFVAGCTGCAGAAGDDFRLCHYAVLNDHLHLLARGARPPRAVARPAGPRRSGSPKP